MSKLDPCLHLAWAYGQCFCCEQLFRDLKSGIIQLDWNGLRDPKRIDRLLLLDAIVVLFSSLQGYGTSVTGERCQVNPHLKRGLSLVRGGLHWLKQSTTTAGRALLAWIAIPLKILETCVQSPGVRRREMEPWFTRVELPPPHQITALMAVA